MYDPYFAAHVVLLRLGSLYSVKADSSCVRTYCPSALYVLFGLLSAFQRNYLDSIGRQALILLFQNWKFSFFFKES